MHRSANEEARYVLAAENLTDARQRFAQVVGRASELIVEKEAEFWDEFLEAYTSKRGAGDASGHSSTHDQFAGEVENFVRGKDRP